MGTISTYTPNAPCAPTQKLNGQPKKLKLRSRAKKATPKVTTNQTSINQAVIDRLLRQ
jgi:hypothetical protein